MGTFHGGKRLSSPWTQEKPNNAQMWEEELHNVQMERREVTVFITNGREELQRREERIRGCETKEKN